MLDHLPLVLLRHLYVTSIWLAESWGRTAIITIPVGQLESGGQSQHRDALFSIPVQRDKLHSRCAPAYLSLRMLKPVLLYDTLVVTPIVSVLVCSYMSLSCLRAFITPTIAPSR
jgi:hypothetical protein